MAVCNHWTGLVDWITVLDYLTDLQPTFTHIIMQLAQVMKDHEDYKICSQILD